MVCTLIGLACLALGVAAQSSNSNSTCSTSLQLPEARLATDFCAIEFPVTVSQPRTILSTNVSQLLALERGTSSVVSLQDTDGDDVPDDLRTIASASGLNHGLAVHGGYIYASSDTTVYRWAFTGSFEVTNADSPQVVIDNINANGQGGAPMGHQTRTLVLDDQGRMFVSVGSASNVDENSFRARIRRFDVSDESVFPIDFLSGDVFADGLRNEVGLAFDKYGVLWGVENGADSLFREDLGGDIHDDNPAEELNRFDTEGAHYGYPYCFTDFRLPNVPESESGQVWGWPSFLEDGTVTDASCRSDYKPSALGMQAHSAPLGITFYAWRPAEERPSICPGGSFPSAMNGYAFIAFHGSWNRDPPTGYKVVYVPMNDQGMVAGTAVDLLSHDGDDAPWSDGFRPVDVDFDECGRLLVSSDGSSGNGAKVVRIEYYGADEESSLGSDIPSDMPSNAPLNEGTPPFDAGSDTPSDSPSDTPSSTPSAIKSPSNLVDFSPTALPITNAVAGNDTGPTTVQGSSSGTTRLHRTVGWTMAGVLLVLATRT